MIATIINSLTIIVGSILGLFFKGRINEKVSNTIMNGLALSVICIGISGAIKGENTIGMIISIVLGGLVGELIDIDSKLENLGKALEKKVNKKGSSISIAEGFVTSTLLFCVGSMAIIGSLQSGMSNDNSTILAKSVLDGVSSIIFSSTLGIGVMISSVSVFLYQGSITLAAGMLSKVLNDVAINNMTAVGSLLIIGLGLNVLGITKIKISNLLPSIFFAVILSFIKI